MIRLASIVGVATVATLVLLSGCQSPMKAEYAKKLVGTWNGSVEHDIQNPQAPGTTIPGLSQVTAEVTRTGTNKGEVSLTIATGPKGATTGEMIMPITVKGSIEVTATEIMVSDVKVDPMAILQQYPALAQDLTLTYKLSDDESKVTVGNAVLFPVLLGQTNAEVTLTKQMEGDG